MAKFTEMLPEVAANYRPVAPVKGYNSAAAFTDALGQGISLFAATSKAIKQQEANEAEIGATTSLLDLQDEAINQQMEFDKVEAQVAGIYADDQVTPQEQETLLSLEKQLGKFDLLDPNKRQLRVNALHKQALADTKNLGIQRQINAVFSKGQSSNFIPAPSGEERFKQELDMEHGVGNWGPVEAGRKRGKGIFLQEQISKAQSNINSVVGEGSLTLSQSYQDTLQQAGKIYAQQGHLRDDQATLFLADLEQKQGALRTQLLGLQKQYADQGIDVTEQVRGLLTDMQKDYDNYSALFQDKGLFGDSVRTKQVLANAVDTMDKLREFRLPVASKALSTLIGGGNGGGIKALQGMLNASDGVLTAMMEDDPSLAQLGSPKQLRENMAAYIAMTLNPMSVEEAINKGYIAPQLAKITSANFGIRNSDTPEQLDNNLTPFATPTSPDTALGELQALNQKDNVAKLLKDGSPQRLGSVALYKAEAISSIMSPAMRELVELSPQGVLQIPIDKVPVGKANARYLNSLLMEYSKYINNYKGKLPDSPEKWFEELLPQAKEEVQQGGEGEQR